MPNNEFADLLTQGLKSIAARENKPIPIIEEGLGDLMGIQGSSIAKWRAGYVPKDPKRIALLAEACVLRGHMDRMWLSRFLTQTSYPDKEILEQKLFPSKEAQTFKVHCNIPGRFYDQFVGREKEINALRKFLSPEHRIGVVCLSGIAGVGKTTLATEVAHWYIDNVVFLHSLERFEAIVFVTAKKAELFSNGLNERLTTLKDLGSVYKALADMYNHSSITRAASKEEQDVLVNSLLSEHRTLLILDNLEDIDDPALMVFLRDLPSPSKAIITTRHRIDVAISLQLRPFNEVEARELTLNECQRRKIELTKEQTERLLQRTGYLALAIVRTISRMAWRGSSIEGELKKLDDPKDSIYSFCFDMSFSLIRDSHTYDLLLALALFSTNASRGALGYVAGFQQDILDRDEGLSDLEGLSLVNKDCGRFSLEVLTKAKIEFELNNYQDFKHKAQERWIEWYKHFVEQVEYPSNCEELSMEIDNIISAIKWLIEQEQMVDVAWFFQQLRKFLFAEGRWEFLLPLSKLVAQWAESENSVDILIDTLETLTRIYREQGNFAYAVKWMDHMQVIAEYQNNELLQAEIWLNRAGTMYRQQIKPAEFAENVRCLLIAVDTFKKRNRKDRAVNALNTLGFIHMQPGGIESALKYYYEALNILDNSDLPIPEARLWRAAIKGNLGRINCLQGHYAQAAREVYEVLSNFTEQTDRAEALSTLIVCERHLGNHKKANEHKQEVKRIYKQLNLVRDFFGKEKWKEE